MVALLHRDRLFGDPGAALMALGSLGEALPAIEHIALVAGPKAASLDIVPKASCPKELHIVIHGGSS